VYRPKQAVCRTTAVSSTRPYFTATIHNGPANTGKPEDGMPSYERAAIGRCMEATFQIFETRLRFQLRLHLSSAARTRRSKLTPG
jgi:hypothetical protein